MDCRNNDINVCIVHLSEKKNVSILQNIENKWIVGI